MFFSFLLLFGLEVVRIAANNNAVDEESRGE